MSFAINPSLTHIDIPDANILEIYRSKGQIQLSDARFRGHPCEAVICLAKVDKTVSARVALLETVMNSIFVYTSDFSAEQSADYPKVLAEAQEFAASFGFTMEKVNLDFSPAMREVIIKGIRVMRPPLKKTKLRSLNRLDYTGQQAPEPPAPTPFPPAAAETADPNELRRLKTELAAAKALVDKITREKETAAASASHEIETLKAAAEKLTREIETLTTEQLDRSRKDHDKQLQQLAAALKEKEAAITALQDEISRLAAQTERSEKAKLQLEEELHTEKSLSTAEISRLKAELDSINSLLTAEKQAAAETKEALASLENSWQESQHREEDLCRNIDIMKEQIDTLATELGTLRQREEREAALLLTIAALEKETGEARAAVNQLASTAPERSALDGELKSLAAAKNEVEAEYIRMANEAMEKEAVLLETLYSADAEILRLSRELEQQRRLAATEKESLRAELLQAKTASAATPAATAAAKGIGGEESAPATAAAVETGTSGKAPARHQPASQPASQPAAPAPETAPPPPPAAQSVSEAVAIEDEAPDEPIIVEDDITKGLVNEFGSFCGSSNHSATEFKVAPDLSSIDYADPAEVLAILYSSNSVQAMPDGGSVQRCKGYVVALKKSAGYRVYLAWLMPESGKVVICTPEQQPADATECTQMILDAVAYFEIVGFMMEVAELGNTVKSYLHAIKKIPALKRI